jgi:hypothetical protein
MNAAAMIHEVVRGLIHAARGRAKIVDVLIMVS